MHRRDGTRVEIVLGSLNVTMIACSGEAVSHYREFLTDNVGEMFTRVGRRPIDRSTARTRFENRWHRIHLRSTTPCPDPINDST